MPDIRLTETFKEFFNNEKSSGIVLMVCSIISLIVANSVFSDSYLSFWKSYVGGLTVSYWVNDGLMAIFFPVDRTRAETRALQGRTLRS